MWALKLVMMVIKTTPTAARTIACSLAVVMGFIVRTSSLATRGTRRVMMAMKCRAMPALRDVLPPAVATG
jgi:hypothetical protein